jgi:hypothetical protein
VQIEPLPRRRPERDDARSRARTTVIRCEAVTTTRRRAADGCDRVPTRYTEPGTAEGLARRPCESFLVGFAIGAAASVIALAISAAARA